MSALELTPGEVLMRARWADLCHRSPKASPRPTMSPPGGVMQIPPLKTKLKRRTSDEIALQDAVKHLRHTGSMENLGRGCRRKCRDAPFFQIVPEDAEEESNGRSPQRVGR